MIAQLRYGEGSDRSFACVEHLLPSAHSTFVQGGGLPRVPGKCLLCKRYSTTFLYMLIRHDPKSAVADEILQTQTFANARPAGPLSTEEALDTPDHASEIGADTGYKASAMLFVDNEFANSRAARENKIGALLFRPFVRFCSTDYAYVKDAEGLRIVQKNVGSRAPEDPFR